MNSNRYIITFGVVALLICAVVIGGTIFVNNGSEPSSSPDFSQNIVPLLESSADDTSVYESSAYDESEQVSEEELSEQSKPPSFPVFKADEIGANYLVLYDATNDAFLYERNADKRCYPASITKLLTALTAFDYLDPKEVITVGSEVTMIGAGSSTAFLQQGFKLTFEQLLDAMMIVSGNDAAYVTAVAAGRRMLGTERGSREAAIEAFVAKMNEKAVSLGMTSTHFSNPDGYHSDDHYTTPRDLAILCRAALENELIAEVCKKTEARYMIASGQTVDYKSTNKFLIDYEYATGLKTGTTNEAGFCLAASANKDGRQLVAVIIGADTASSRFTSAEYIFDLAYFGA